jgi:hypothetical protein
MQNFAAAHRKSAGEGVVTYPARQLPRGVIAGKFIA